MYCVRCGVKLQEGVEACPLCGTPVWNPEETPREKTYPNNLPTLYSERNLPAVIGMTVLCAAACVAMLVSNLALYGVLEWGGYALGGILLFYVLVILPGWFRKPKWEILIPADHAAIALFTLYVCSKTGGSWFLSFAFPLIGISCLLITGLYTLLKHVRGGKPYILGGFLVALGGMTMLIEFFAHITFGDPMFRWSLYTASTFCVAGLFLLLAGIIRPLRVAMRKHFFY